ncbi:MAG: peptidoglycan DD-metalloendopeptidase family protein [Sulfurospirillaceae bacterium]|nr:peptidoglycan DD-metalloendopeptidase family protein [Sulfurospirillaceae bacterium]MDD3463730.1 peptidoglycan DD-metalloendopeptidase family protein [Sulfurospirillaceae bacterium]
MVRIVFFVLVFVSCVFGSHVEELRWSNGETFLSFLEKHSLPLKIYYNLDKEEQELATEIMSDVRYHILRSESNEIEQVLIPVGEELQIHIKKNIDEYVLEIIPVIYQEESLSLVLDIQKSPYQDIVDATNNYLLANEFVYSFKNSLNFRTLTKGDKLAIFYTMKTRLGKQYGSPKISTSMIEIRGKKRYSFLYEDGKYYDEKGVQLEGFLLARPVNYTRISSPFTTKRFHPVLKKYRAHLGIDYAARVGTPVRSAGDGKISFVGRKGGYGKTIIVNHSSGYKTLYAHLNGFAKKSRNGKSVKKGEVIGYVGNTGMSTGPHLHFGLYKNNVAINPASVIQVAKNLLTGKEITKFLQYTNEVKESIQKALLDNNFVPKKEESFASFEPLKREEK